MNERRRQGAVRVTEGRFFGGSCPPAYVAEKDNVERGKERNVNSISRRKGNNVPPDR